MPSKRRVYLVWDRPRGVRLALQKALPSETAAEERDLFPYKRSACPCAHSAFHRTNACCIIALLLLYKQALSGESFRRDPHLYHLQRLRSISLVPPEAQLPLSPAEGPREESIPDYYCKTIHSGVLTPVSQTLALSMFSVTREAIVQHIYCRPGLRTI